MRIFEKEILTKRKYYCDILFLLWYNKSVNIYEGGNKMEKLKKIPISLYVILFVIFIIILSVFLDSNSNNKSINEDSNNNYEYNGYGNNENSDNNSGNNENSDKQTKDEEQLIKLINNNISKTYKYKNVTLEKDGDKYIAIIPFQSENRYSDNIWCGIDGISVINSIKYYGYDEVDTKISKYIMEFYINDNLVYTSEVINTFEKKINEITIIDSDKKSRTITQNDINQYHNENHKTENNTTSNEDYIYKTITCNSKKITIKKIKRINHEINSYVPSGKEWIGIYIIFKNQSNEDMDYYESDFNLVNGNGEVLKPIFNVIKGVFDYDRFNNGTLIANGQTEGYVIFANDILNDKNLSLRITCLNNLIKDDKIETVKLY